MREYLPEPISLGGKDDLDLFNYSTKVDLKNATDAGTWKFAIKVDLASLKSEVDKLDIEKLEKVPTVWNVK